MPPEHARARLTLLPCFDGSVRPLTEKILERPRLLARIREAVGDPANAHLAAYTVSALERTLAVRLGIPLYGCDPELQHLGTKSGGRKLMREAGVAIPDGAEDLTDAADIATALARSETPPARTARAVVKLNEGFSGDGNAVFRFDDAPAGAALPPGCARGCRDWRSRRAGMTWDAYRGKVAAMGAIVEAFIEGEEKRSPSVQFRIDPLARWKASRRTIRCSAGRAGRCSWAAAFRPMRRIGWQSRRRARRSRLCWRSRACWAVSASISSRCARATGGGTTPSRSTCARAARRIRS